MAYKADRDKTRQEKIAEKAVKNTIELEYNSAKLGQRKVHYMPRKERKEIERRIRKEKIEKLKSSRQPSDTGRDEGGHSEA